MQAAVALTSKRLNAILLHEALQCSAYRCVSTLSPSADDACRSASTSRSWRFSQTSTSQRQAPFVRPAAGHSRRFFAQEQFAQAAIQPEASSSQLYEVWRFRYARASEMLWQGIHGTHRLPVFVFCLHMMSFVVSSVLH